MKAGPSGSGFFIACVYFLLLVYIVFFARLM